MVLEYMRYFLTCDECFVVEMVCSFLGFFLFVCLFVFLLFKNIKKEKIELKIFAEILWKGDKIDQLQLDKIIA